MTRETKIGLLVGLAFIVVFAMLLSHTGTVPAPGDGLQLAKGRADTLPPVMDRAVDPDLDINSLLSTDPGSMASPTPSIDRPGAAATSLVQLPTPDVLDTPGGFFDEPAIEQPLPHAGAASSFHDSSPLATGTMSSLEGNRVAPPLPQVPTPTPTPRDTAPVAVTPAPQPFPVPTNAVVAAPPAVAQAPVVQPKEKEYVVKKGQTLLQIAREVYGDAYAAAPMKVLEFLLKSNKDNVKNKHFVVEGQKLATTALPLELFEPVTNLNVAQTTERVANLDSLINRTDQPVARQAPPVKPDAAKKAEAAAKPARERLHEVRVNETFSSIARDQLGSEALWREIQKMNKNIDPVRMKPGTMIQLPARGSAQQASASGRVRQ